MSGSPLVQIIPESDFDRVRAFGGDTFKRVGLIADMCRYNTLTAVKRAGSGHLGTSFSAMDIICWLYHELLNTAKIGLEHPDRDIFFSSKGHDVPALYSVLYSVGVVSRAQLLNLRRLGGLHGHPNVSTRGIEANTGSLGMGLSKARGMAWAKRRLGRGGRVVVMTGDGELQEGQNYEALRAATRQDTAKLTLVVDHNKVQSDKPVSEIMDLGDIVAMLQTFGWNVVRCDGHDLRAIEQAFAALDDDARPGALVADTIKGRGVSFMEHPRALRDGGGLYRWHAGAPDDESFTIAEAELRAGITDQATSIGVEPPRFEEIAGPANAPSPAASLGEPQSRAEISRGESKDIQEYVVEAYGQALVEIGRQRDDLVVLDADLAADCRLRSFELEFPERFIQNGIAEQDMVSMAGGLARQGLLPVVNSFASFLASRANEQIYNNVTERSRVIYACHYAGLIPAGPGDSHQSLRDISLLGSLPEIVIIQPAHALETQRALEFCVKEARESCVLRLNIGPSPRAIPAPDDYTFEPGRGTFIELGDDALIIAYGPVMLAEAMGAAELLRREGIGLSVLNMPWLNRFADDWLHRIVGQYSRILVVEDHSPVGGLGDRLHRRLVGLGLAAGCTFVVCGIEGFPAFGTPSEVLGFHQLDAPGLARRVQDLIRG